MYVRKNLIVIFKKAWEYFDRGSEDAPVCAFPTDVVSSAEPEISQRSEN